MFRKNFLTVIGVLSVLYLAGCTVNMPASLGGVGTMEAPASLVKGSQYQGSYYCQQGLTNLNLSINQVQDVYYQGVFSFYHDEKQQGSFYVHGSFDGNRFVAKPGDWISRPTGYSTVGLTGKYNAQTGGFNGNVDAPGCGTFRLNPVK